MGRYIRTAAALGALALVAGACGGDPAPRDEPTGPPSSTAPSTNPTDPPSASPSEPAATPSVGPASGPVLEVGAIRISAPEKWRQNNDTVFADSAIGPVGDGRSGSLVLGATAIDQLSLDAAMKRSWRGKKPAGFAEQESTVLGGLTAFYYTAPDGPLDIDHVMGLWDSGYVVEVRLSLPKAVTAGEREAIVESVRLSYDRVGS